MSNTLKKRFSLDNYYTDVENCPIKRYFDASEDNAISLRKDPSIGSIELDTKAYEMLYNSYSEKIGFSDEYNRYLELIGELNQKMHDFIASLNPDTGWRNRRMINDINELQEELKSMTENKPNFDFYLSLVALQKAYGQKIDPNTTTVIEFMKIKQFVENERTKIT